MQPLRFKRRKSREERLIDQVDQLIAKCLPHGAEQTSLQPPK
jgi:hypothetical protein